MEKNMTKTSIIKNSLIEVLKDYRTHDLEEIKAYIRKTYPDVEISKSTFNTIFNRQKNTVKNLESLGKGRYQMVDSISLPESLKECCMIDEYIDKMEESFTNLYSPNKKSSFFDTTTEQEFVFEKAILESQKRLRKVVAGEKKQLELAKQKIQLLAELDKK